MAVQAPPVARAPERSVTRLTSAAMPTPAALANSSTFVSVRRLCSTACLRGEGHGRIWQSGRQIKLQLSEWCQDCELQSTTMLPLPSRLPAFTWPGQHLYEIARS